ncbi:hypothetical protein [Streptomyces sp. cg35]|uniref:hypothetical protein n=1 Tax=Streptomyces sp. cg35 TaxID=3421650 RepID=UPI003D1748C7
MERFVEPCGSDRAGQQLCIQLTRLSELVRYAQDVMELKAEDADVFMPLYAVLLHGACPDSVVIRRLRRPAECAVGQAALTASLSCPQRETAVQLLMTVWSASLTPDAEAELWAARAPDLPTRCLRAAATDSGPPSPMPLA